MKVQPVLALGVMSGTSLDGVDVVALRTDGEAAIELLGHSYLKYPEELKARLRKVSVGDVPLLEVMRLERDVSVLYAKALVAAVKKLKLSWKKVGVVGVHGQTIRHKPDESLTWQLGDASRVLAGLQADGCGGPVVMDFRRQDLANGGEGAPLVPLFHAALLAKEKRPLAVLNLGGVANVTLVDKKGGVFASDCGPAMGLLDQLFLERTGKEVDAGGKVTLKGQVDAKVLAKMGSVRFFQRPVPRSADRYEFKVLLDSVNKLDLDDAAATLAAVTARGVAWTVQELGAGRSPDQARGRGPGRLVWCGGGGRNKGVVRALEREGFEVSGIAELGIREDWVEAACFGWLAVRRLRNLTFTLPTTTKGTKPSGGGVVAA